MYRDRPLRRALAEDGGAARPGDRVPGLRPAAMPLLPEAPGWRRGVQAELIEARLRSDGEKQDQGGVRRAQRDLDRRHLRHRRRAQGDRCRRPSRRCCWSTRISGLACADLPPRRMGRRRHRQRLAEGPDAAAGHQLQRRLAARARGVEDGEAAARLLGLGRDRRDEQDGYWPYTPNTNLLYGLHEALDMLLGEGPGQRLRAPPALGRRRARRGRRLGPADPVRRPGALLAGADRRDHAGRASMPTRCARLILRALRPVARHRPGQGQGPHVPHRPPRRQQRPDAAGDAGRLRDGPEARRRAAWPAAACRRRWITSPATPRAPRSPRPRSDQRGRCSAVATYFSLPAFRGFERCNDAPFSRPPAPPSPPSPRRASWRRNGPTRRCASSSAFRPAAAPTRWPASSPQKLTRDVEPAGHRRDQGRRRRRPRRRIRGAAAERRQRRC